MSMVIPHYQSLCNTRFSALKMLKNRWKESHLSAHLKTVHSELQRWTAMHRTRSSMCTHGHSLSLRHPRLGRKWCLLFRTQESRQKRDSEWNRCPPLSCPHFLQPQLHFLRQKGWVWTLSLEVAVRMQNAGTDRYQRWLQDQCFCGIVRTGLAIC